MSNTNNEQLRAHLIPKLPGNSPVHGVWLGDYLLITIGVKGVVERKLLVHFQVQLWMIIVLKHDNGWLVGIFGFFLFLNFLYKKCEEMMML
jgi:hypothetical protein